VQSPPAGRATRRACDPRDDWGLERARGALRIPLDTLVAPVKRTLRCAAAALLLVVSGCAPTVIVGGADGGTGGDGADDGPGGDGAPTCVKAERGTFGAAVSYAVGSHPVSVAAGDLNGDGGVDLIVANNYGEVLSRLR
jgi:hypothetical protein